MWWSFNLSFCKTNDKENRIIYNISSVRLVCLDSFSSAIFIFYYFTAFYKFCLKLFSFFFHSKKNNKFEMNIKNNAYFLFVWTEFWRLEIKWGNFCDTDVKHVIPYYQTWKNILLHFMWSLIVTIAPKVSLKIS